MNSTNKSASSRAVAALNSLLSQVSAIRLKDIGVGAPECGAIDILAYVEIFGRKHTVACQMSPGAETEDARETLQQLRNCIAHLPGDVTPMLLVQVLSPEVQSLCAENQVGCLDLRGNGRLCIGEVFVSMRSLPRHAFHHAASQARRMAGEGAVPSSVTHGFSPLPVRVSQHSARAAGSAHSL